MNNHEVAVYHTRIVDSSIHVCIFNIDVLNYGYGSMSHILHISIWLYTYTHGL